MKACYQVVVLLNKIVYLGIPEKTQFVFGVYQRSVSVIPGSQKCCFLSISFPSNIYLDCFPLGTVVFISSR